MTELTSPSLKPNIVENAENGRKDRHPSQVPAIDLVLELCRALDREGIQYCHWKSNNALDRSASAENDLDLLVARKDGGKFLQLLFHLGFKQVKAPAEKQMPGVLDYWGFDPEADRLVHVHAHYQLAIGHDMTKNIRLPIENAYLESASSDGLFRVPEPEFEFVVFVIRMILKHGTWDAILFGEGKLKASERREFDHLHERMNPARVEEILRCHLQFIDRSLFWNCVEALRPGASPASRIRVSSAMQARLQANALHPVWMETILKLSRRAYLLVRRRLFKSSPRYQLQIGGAMIAMLGGDGAGKSTAVDALQAWLARTFAVKRVHMGKPAWSRLTILIRSLLKLGQIIRLYPLEASFEDTLRQKSLVSPGYPYLIREVCRARDRYHTYLKARRFAARGGLVLLDRFPMPQIQIMDGIQGERFVRELQAGPGGRQFLAPSLESRFARFLVRLEESYYQQVAQPEILVVLKVHPDIAAARKTDEDPISVKTRSTEIWNLDWHGTAAYVIDTSQSRAEVITQLKEYIWPRL